MISKNGTALVILVAEALLTALGIEFDEGSLAKFVEATLVMASFILMIWNQWDRPDVRGFIFKQ